MSVGAVNKQTGDRIPTAGMPAIDDALDLTSVNPVQNAIVAAALALKQDKTDNNLTTTDKTTTGAINELKSGLINYQTQNDINLEVPDRRNLWDGNYTDITAQTVTYKPIKVADGNYTISTTCPQNSLNGANIFFLSGNVQEGASTSGNGVWEGNTRTVESANGYITIAYKLDGGVDPRNYNTQIEYGSTATAYTPYIPSVNSRLETVESGLTNIDVALSVPENSGKNLIPMTLAAIKTANTVGTWSGNAYTANDVTFTVQTDGDGNVTGITANGTATQGILFYLYKKDSDTSFPTNDYILTGCADGGSNSTWRIIGVEVEGGSNVYFGDSGSGATFNTTATKYLNQLYIEVFSGVNISNKTFYPMVRLASVSDSTFAPYIPSVESRIEAVESGLTDANTALNNLNNYHRKVAQSAQTGTIADKLNSLAAAFTSLSNEEKQRAYVLHDSKTHYIHNRYNGRFATVGMYSSNAMTTYILRLDATSSEYGSYTIPTSGSPSYTDMSSTENTQTCSLWV